MLLLWCDRTQSNELPHLQGPGHIKVFQMYGEGEEEGDIFVVRKDRIPMDDEVGNLNKYKY
jgi:hypothetical protein